MFNKALKMLIASAKIKENYSMHSLPRGGTTSMRAAGVPLSYKGKGPLCLTSISSPQWAIS